MQIVIDIPEEIYRHILSMQFYIPGSRSGKSLLEKILKAIRTGTPLPKGHWIKDYDSALDGLYHCSVCGRKLWIPKEESVSDYPYCHCGAEMESD